MCGMRAYDDDIWTFIEARNSVTLEELQMQYPNDGSAIELSLSGLEYNGMIRRDGNNITVLAHSVCLQRIRVLDNTDE